MKIAKDILKDSFNAVLIGLAAATLVFIAVAVYLDSNQTERDDATCRSHGMEMTSLRQGSGKNTHSVHVCVNKDGQLYVF